MSDTAPLSPLTERVEHVVSRWQKYVAFALSVLALTGALAAAAPRLLGLEPAAAHAADVRQLRQERDSVLSLLRRDIAEVRREQGEQRQWTACLVWKVPAAECRTFQVPLGAPPAPETP